MRLSEEEAKRQARITADKYFPADDKKRQRRMITKPPAGWPAPQAFWGPNPAHSITFDFGPVMETSEAIVGGLCTVRTSHGHTFTLRI